MILFDTHEIFREEHLLVHFHFTMHFLLATVPLPDAHDQLAIHPGNFLQGTSREVETQVGAIFQFHARARLWKQGCFCAMERMVVKRMNLNDSSERQTNVNWCFSLCSLSLWPNRVGELKSIRPWRT